MNRGRSGRGLAKWATGNTLEMGGNGKRRTAGGFGRDGGGGGGWQAAGRWVALYCAGAKEGGKLGEGRIQRSMLKAGSGTLEAR